MKRQQGFTLIELIAVILIIAVLSISLTSSIKPSALQQLQAARDMTINALRLAQQTAMSQTASVQFSSSSNTIDISVGGSSIQAAGNKYPKNLPGNVSLSNHSIAYNRLGHTTATTFVLSLGARSVTVNVSGVGYAY